MIEKVKELLVLNIINSKNLKNLDKEYVELKLEKFILTYGDIYKKLKMHVEKKGIDSIEKNKYFKEIVKRLRSEINIVYSSFLTDDFFKKNIDLDFEDILKFHKSTKERFEYYDEIYSKIFDWFQPRKIADLACGLNPCSYFLIKQKIGDFEYFVSDLSSYDMEFIQKFFDKYKIKGIAKAYDITDMSIFSDKDFLDSDLVFLFKALDSFEEVKKNISKEILEKIEAKKIVVSFPTKSLQSKKEFKIEKRNWFFNFLNKKGWSYQQFEVENELFLLINK